MTVRYSDTVPDELKTYALQSYLHDSMADIGERLDRMATKFIPVFIDLG